MDLGAYAGKGMGSLDKVGAQRKGIWYPHRKTSTTQGSAPSSLHSCQWSDRQPPIAIGSGHDSYLRKPLLRFEEGVLPLPLRVRLLSPRRGDADLFRYPEVLGLEKSSGEDEPPEPEAPERPREATLDDEASEAVEEINESSLMFETTFSSNGWLKSKLSVPGATNSSRFTESPTGQKA